MYSRVYGREGGREEDGMLTGGTADSWICSGGGGSLVLIIWQWNVRCLMIND